MHRLKGGLQAVLRRVGLYHRLKGSLIYDAYWRLADRSIIEERREETVFYRNLLVGLGEGDLIYDVGAHQGKKTRIFLDLGARVVAVEPDEANQEALRGMFLEYRRNAKPLVIVGKALSDECSAETMWFDEPGSATGTFSEKWVDVLKGDQERLGRPWHFQLQKVVETSTLDSLFAGFGLPFFVKIDVEGYELKVLRGMHSPVPFLSFEVNLPEFRTDGLKCVQLLDGLATGGRFNYTADCRDGLALPEWLDADGFFEVLSRCSDTSIEVFWRSTSAPGG